MGWPAAKRKSWPEAANIAGKPELRSWTFG